MAISISVRNVHRVLRRNHEPAAPLVDSIVDGLMITRTTYPIHRLAEFLHKTPRSIDRWHSLQDARPEVVDDTTLGSWLKH